MRARADSGIRCSSVWLAVALASAAPCRGADLRLHVDDAVTAVECLPVVVEAELRNHGDQPLRLAVPDAFYNVSAAFGAEPEALAATFLLGGGFVPESPPAVLELGPGESVTLQAWLDEGHPAGLLAGTYRVRLRYRPAGRYASWETSPELARLIVTSNETTLTVLAPTAEGDRAALAIYRGEYAAYWGVGWGVRVRRPDRPLFSLCTPGELRDLTDAKRAAGLLVAAQTAPLRLLWARLGPEGQAAARAVAEAKELTRAQVELLVGWLNEMILGPPLGDALGLRDADLSAATRRILQAPTPLADVAPANRAILEDLLPGCLRPTLFRIAHAEPANAYTPVAMYMLAEAYKLRRHDPVRSLGWLDRLAAAAPEWSLRGRADWLRFEALFDQDRLDEAAALAERLTDGRQLAQYLLLVRRERAAGQAPPP